MHAFYCGFSSDIRTLVGKRNDLSLKKMYEIEKANQELEVRYESQQIYTFSDFHATRTVSSETALRGTNGEIKETTIADRIRANNLMINPYLISQIVGTESIIIVNERNLK